MIGPYYIASNIATTQLGWAGWDGLGMLRWLLAVIACLYFNIYSFQELVMLESDISMILYICLFLLKYFKPTFIVTLASLELTM